MRLNINADLGESWGAFRMGEDEALLGIVQSANLACGMHGGDPLVMARTVAAARARGVSIGAHPGYADLHGFGRRAMDLGEEELAALITYQLGALAAIARAGGATMTHVKPHGAMSNRACADPEMAGLIARTVAAFDPGLILLAPALSDLARAGAVVGLRVAAEVFADRTYEEDGQLTPRRMPGAVLHEAGMMRDHVLTMVDAGGIVTRGGVVLDVPFQSICVHGDGPAAVAGARAVAGALAAAGHDLVPLPLLV
ncbi:MAG: LamB/YcsF family protein [Rubellimicrobium sp.]|nr:LamB/YcsF family protein [Rubellimicrobium sp.]